MSSRGYCGVSNLTGVHPNDLCLTNPDQVHRCRIPHIHRQPLLRHTDVHSSQPRAHQSVVHFPILRQGAMALLPNTGSTNLAERLLAFFPFRFVVCVLRGVEGPVDGGSFDSPDDLRVFSPWTQGVEVSASHSSAHDHFVGKVFGGFRHG